MASFLIKLSKHVQKKREKTEICKTKSGHKRRKLLNLERERERVATETREIYPQNPCLHLKK
jgi:hypothetical protein